jgi:hypothetical protein
LTKVRRVHRVGGGVTATDGDHGAILVGQRDDGLPWAQPDCVPGKEQPVTGKTHQLASRGD